MLKFLHVRAVARALAVLVVALVVGCAAHSQMT